MADNREHHAAGRRLGAGLGAFGTSVFAVVGFDLAADILEFTLLVTGGALALFLAREGIDQLWRRRGSG